MNENKVRLSKLMSEKGICSRREADDFISRGLVYVDGVKITELGTKVSLNARVTLETSALQEQKQLVTILINKPIGYVSSQPEKDYEPAIALIEVKNYFGDGPCPLKSEHRRGLAVAGRLDIDSQGLLILTQDGRLAKKIIGEKSEIEKEYLVRISPSPTQRQLSQLRHGLELDGQALKPAQVEIINQDQIRIVLKEGKKRQIRRMCELVGLEIRGLKRVRIGQLKLGALPEGQWRYLGSHERI